MSIEIKLERVFHENEDGLEVNQYINGATGLFIHTAIDYEENTTRLQVRVPGEETFNLIDVEGELMVTAKGAMHSVAPLPVISFTPCGDYGVFKMEGRK